jgi:hypothetical protein
VIEQRDGTGRVVVRLPETVEEAREVESWGREHEHADGCGQISTTYRGPAPAYLYGEPSLDSLRREALSELVSWERSIGVDIPPRNPGLVEDDGLPAWLLLVVLVAAFGAGLVLVLLLEAVS